MLIDIEGLEPIVDGTAPESGVLDYIRIEMTNSAKK